MIKASCKTKKEKHPPCATKRDNSTAAKKNRGGIKKELLEVALFLFG